MVWCLFLIYHLWNETKLEESTLPFRWYFLCVLTSSCPLWLISSTASGVVSDSSRRSLLPSYGLSGCGRWSRWERQRCLSRLGTYRSCSSVRSPIGRNSTQIAWRKKEKCYCENLRNTCKVLEKPGFTAMVMFKVIKLKVHYLFGK